MSKLKSLLSGINNMLIFIFKVDCTKWGHLFDNSFIKVRGYITEFKFYLLPSFDFILIKEHLLLGTWNNKLLFTIRIYKYIIYISFNNK